MPDTHTHSLKVYITIQTDENEWHQVQLPVTVTLTTKPAEEAILSAFDPIDGEDVKVAPRIEREYAPGHRGKWVPGGTTRQDAAAAVPQPDDQVGTWGSDIDAQRLARRFAHAERHVPELLAQLNRLMSSQKFSWAEIKEKVRKRGEELAQEDPPDADPF